VPPLPRWFVRCSLLYLLAGVTLGAVLLIDKALAGPAPAVWRWRAAHVELLLFGFVVQLVMGVALWIFPRFGAHRSRWAQPAARLAFATLNGGILLAAAGAVFGGQTGDDVLLAAGRTLEIGAAVAFASGLLPRLRASISEM
jgi:hypothetical protein